MDSDNILSIIASLGSGAPDANQSNVLQQAAPVPMIAQTPPAVLANPPAAPVVHQKRRVSAIDAIGRIADTLAKIGGATPMYQPTLDAVQDRDIALQDHARQVDLDGLRESLLHQQVEAGALQPGIDERKRIGVALSALNGQDNAAELWPAIAAQAGIDPQKAQAINGILQANPAAAGILAKSLGADSSDLGKNVYFGTDPTGKTVAYQVGPDGNPHILDFHGTLTPSDPIKTVNLGDKTVIVGQGGQTKKILPNGEAPGRSADRRERGREADNRNRTQITIAGMPGRNNLGKGGTGDPSAMIATAQGNLDELRGVYRDLKKMGAMVSPGQGTGANVTARLRASGVGQVLEGAVGTQAQTLRDRVNSIRPQLMQSIAKATGMTGKQLDSNADVKLFMQTVTNPASSYEANVKAIDGLERFLKANSKQAPAAPSPATKKPSNSGWGKATVVGG